MVVEFNVAVDDATTDAPGVELRGAQAYFSARASPHLSAFDWERAAAEVGLYPDPNPYPNPDPNPNPNPNPNPSPN